MSKPLVSDELWAVVEPLLAKEPPKPKETAHQHPLVVGNSATKQLMGLPRMFYADSASGGRG
jgi:hypothetical protein